ncbi:hypothetical protein BcanWSM471_33965 [Bradyrhizobium sp. WSM471]|uniref:hypothetical protein n=1 Tax=Bradyrhizobium sp. WSM471 TaxID=319017 RepID=UPI00031D0591|nr:MULTISPECIES: hypothetical protein [Bradyrhizobium]UFW41158.1 hypothetical protein BcanWSM471_33965 [Bradyrhizobium canariense]
MRGLISAYERRFHCLPRPDRLVACVELDVAPAHDLAMGDVVLQLQPMRDFVGLSFQYADYSLRYGHTESGPPSIVSTVKINRAGFTEMMDTEDMFRKWFRQAKEERLLP